jgi:hypothetical protein
MEPEAAKPSARSAAIVGALAKSLRQLTGENFGDDPERWLQWRDEHKEEFAAPPAPPPETKKP